MQITARKLVATAAAAALLASLVSPVAMAANITDIEVNGGTTLLASAQITTIEFSIPANVEEVVVQYPAALTETAFDAADVAVTGVIGVAAGDATINLGANTIVLTGSGANAAGTALVTISNSALQAPASGLLTFGVSAGADQGAAVIAVAGANQVVVSATVVPTLSMAIADTSIDLGTLSSTDVNDSNASNITISTNAADGYTLSAAAVSPDAAMPLVSRAALTPTNVNGFAVYVDDVTGVGDATVGFDGDTAATAIDGTAEAIAASTAPAAADVVAVKYAGGISSTTPAGAYTFTTTYTISGSF